MAQWRYHSVLVRDLSIVESKLNVEGEKGWELVSVCLIDANSARCFFKMPVEQGETASAGSAESVGYAPPPSSGYGNPPPIGLSGHDTAVVTEEPILAGHAPFA